jgi:hypothetical protein
MQYLNIRVMMPLSNVNGHPAAHGDKNVNFTELIPIT